MKEDLKIRGPVVPKNTRILVMRACKMVALSRNPKPPEALMRASGSSWSLQLQSNLKP